MTALVLDSSAAVAYLLWTDSGRSVAGHLGSGVTLHAPHLFAVEVTSALRGLVLGRHLSAERAGDALADLADLSVTRHAVEPYLGRIWSLRANLTTYDATYVALAEALDVALLTTDRKFDTAPVRRVVEVRVVR